MFDVQCLELPSRRSVMSELHEAAFSGNLEALKECLQTDFNASEPDPGWGGRAPLHIASGQGHLDCVTLLLDAGAQVNAVTDAGWTPAHYACETGQVNAIINDVG